MDKTFGGKILMCVKSSLNKVTLKPHFYINNKINSAKQTNSIL